MFLRNTRRFKDGKEHRYWSIVENRRCAGGKIVQRPVLYLGEIYTRQKFRAWLWRKHGRRKGRYQFYTYQKLHHQYGLWKWPGTIGHRNKSA